jgi:lysophospholipase L1-like esterase
MIDCAILGDSIAVGVHYQRPECYYRAVSGISSSSFIRRFPDRVSANKVLISLGSNDGNANDTRAALETLRGLITDGEVTWLLSANNPAAYDIARAIAVRYRDRVLEVGSVVGRDRVHPTAAGYRELANGWRN